MTAPRPHAELAARQTVADELRLAKRAITMAGLNGWGNLFSDAADTIDNLRAQLAEAQRDAERYSWLRMNRLWLKANLPTIAAPDFDATIDAAIGAVKGKSNE